MFGTKAALTVLIAIFGLQTLLETPAKAQSTKSEVELGRLELSSTIAPVLIRAALEARAVFTPEMAIFYNLSLPEISHELEIDAGGLEYIKSPLQNLALFRSLLATGETNLRNVVDQDKEKLLAVFLGVASDEDIPITEGTVETVVANLSKDLDKPLSVDVVALAVDAEAVRRATRTRSD